MKEADFVIATQPIDGIDVNSVGIIKSTSKENARVYFVGKHEEVIVPLHALSIIDVDKTGDLFPHKICNICHILKSTEAFPKNQTQTGGRIIRRPTCESCRKIIDGKKLTAVERRRLDAERQHDKSVFVCPICKKRTVIGVTANIVRDHDHGTGMGREWICDSCNTGLGRFRDDIVILEVAIEYLKRHQSDDSDTTHQPSLFDL